MEHHTLNTLENLTVTRQLTTEELDRMIIPALREARVIYEFKRIDAGCGADKKELSEGALDKLASIFKGVEKQRDFETVGRALAKVYADQIGELSDSAWRKLLEVIGGLLELVETGKASPEQLYMHVLRIVGTLKRKEKGKGKVKKEEPPKLKEAYDQNTAYGQAMGTVLGDTQPTDSFANIGQAIDENCSQQLAKLDSRDRKKLVYAITKLIAFSFNKGADLTQIINLIEREHRQASGFDKRMGVKSDNEKRT